ncbi:MAG: hypothetical protein HY900_33995 [Deltaproteobacteria bacterium]|nr:hypothetical protein [Deltaproteobacteria bacterium]
MLRKVINLVAKPLGYELTRRRRGVHGHGGIEIYRYTKRDGTFDYQRYREVQIAGNKKKIEATWVLEENIAFLSRYIRKTVGDVAFGICHGTRRGKEQEWFRKHLGCEVIGTEISDTANDFPHTIQWDFHEAKPEWLNSVDFIYSNSFDHTYDPEKCLGVWMSCVKPGKICIIEHTSDHEKACELDPFGALITQMPYLVLSWGKGRFFVREILSAPSKLDSVAFTQFLVIQRAEELVHPLSTSPEEAEKAACSAPST